MTLREFTLAIEAYAEREKDKGEVIKWQTAHIIAPWLGKNQTVKSILSKWSPQEDVEPTGGAGKTPMDLSRERFLAERKAKTGGEYDTDHWDGFLR